MVKRFIAVVPSLTGAETLTALRQQYDPVANIVPPHVTLVFPFESDLTASDVRAHVEDSVQGVISFPIRLSGVTGSEGEYLFLNVKRGRDALTKLHDRLYSGRLSSYWSARHTYVPHLTVGRLSSPEDFHDALNVVTKAGLTFEMLVSAVSVYRIESAGPVNLESTVTLD